MIQSRDLVLMARAPEPGRTKTRLIPDLGPDGAAALADAMFKDTIALATADRSVTVHIAMDRAGDATYFASTAPGVDLFEQRGATFGERLANAMTDVTTGANIVVALGADCPHMASDTLEHAWECLESSTADVVLGPATDGGYYLIGWSKPRPEIVAPVEMSTPRVLADTTALASNLGLTLSLMDLEFDIDEIDDVRRLCRLLSRAEGTAPITHVALNRLRL